MAAAHDLITTHISEDPTIMTGKPVVKGSRIPVARVLAQLASPDLADLFAAYPELTPAAVEACLAYGRQSGHRQQN